MKHIVCALVFGLVITLPLTHARDDEPEDDDENNEQYETDAADDAEQQANQVVPESSGPNLPAAAQLLQQQGPATPVGISEAAAPAPAAAAPQASAKVDAMNAKKAAKVAKQAAKVANKVAKHSLKITGHAKKALTHALGALHDARVDSAGLGKHQKESLKKAEAHLREATKKSRLRQADEGER